MPLDKSYLEYPLRQHGMDHNLYPWTNMFERKPIKWPNEARVALWLVPALEFFPLVPNDGPFRAPGHMVTPYPDYRTYTSRDYGTRVGWQRMIKVFDKHKVNVSVAMNAAIAERYPFLVGQIKERNWEIIAHGQDMNTLHYGGLEEAQEAEQIQKTVDVLRKASGQEVTGWLSPARSQSENTLHLLPKHGIEYCGDWVNDDLPYEVTTRNGSLLSLPHSNEIDDRTILVNNRHTEDMFVEQVIDAFDLLYAESDKYGGRVMPISLCPYVIGQPWRIKSLDEILSYIMGKDGVWSATGAEIAKAWREQQ